MKLFAVIGAVKLAPRAVARALIALGGLAVSLSVGLIYPPAGGIVLGGGLVVYGLLFVDTDKR